MDFYNQVPTGSLYLSATKWFDYMDDKGTTTKVIAIASRHAPYVVVAYTILVTLIFGALLRIVHYLVLAYFPLRNSGNRNVMLVAFYNSTNFTTSLVLMWDYLEHAMRHSYRSRKKKTDWMTFRAAGALMLIAIVMIAGDAAAKFTVGANRLIVGNVAVVDPSAIFYPDINKLLERNTLDPAYVKLMRLRVTAAETAAGRYETLKNELKSRVSISFGTPASDDPVNKPEVDFNYTYSMTGLEMGILAAPTLEYRVTGYCRTMYDEIWQDGDWDNYYLFGDRNQSASEWLNATRDAFSPPYINVNVDPINPDYAAGQRFCIVPHTAGRRNFVPYLSDPTATDTRNTRDPWYMTEKTPNTQNDDEYRVRRARPPLECRQRDTYAYGGNTVNNVDEISTLSGLQISKFIYNVLGLEFGSPPIIQIANNMGYLALESSRFYQPTQGQFDAVNGDIRNDMARLINIAFLASREVVRNTVLLYPALAKQDSSIPNLSSEASTNDILLEATSASALSVYTLIATPVVCIVLWIVVALRLFWLSHRWVSSQDSPLTRLNIRSAALQATQLYCFLDEKTTGNGGKKWSDRLSLAPFIKHQEKDRHIVCDDVADGGGGSVDAHTTPLLVAINGAANARMSNMTGVTDDDPGGLKHGVTTTTMDEPAPGETRYMVQMAAEGHEDLEGGMGGGGVAIARDGGVVDFSHIISDIS